MCVYTVVAFLLVLVISKENCLNEQSTVYYEAEDWIVTDIPNGTYLSMCSDLDILPPNTSNEASDDDEGLIFVIKRNGTGPDVMVLSMNGTYLHGWGEGLLVKPHALRIQTTNQTSFVWIVDQMDETVKQFSLTGELVLTLGQSGTAGNTTDPLLFDRPTDISFDPYNRFAYISEGEGDTNQLTKVDLQNGVFNATRLGSGVTGSGVGEFHKAHSIEYDVLTVQAEAHGSESKQSVLIVSDELNNRVQFISPENGTTLYLPWAQQCEVEMPSSTSPTL